MNQSLERQGPGPRELRRIVSLSAEAIASLTSTVRIVSLTDVVLGLIANSLDARSTKVHCKVNFAIRTCIVEDNGEGIGAAEFAESGGLAKPHCTSKLLATESHGRSGTFLSSLAALALVSISSRQSPGYPNSTLALYRSQVIRRSVSTPTAETSSTEGHGTRVSVRKLFDDFPVRSKHHTVLDEQDDNGTQWNDLRRRIVALLIAWPHVVSIVLSDEATPAKLSFVGTSIAEALSTHEANARDRIAHEPNHEMRLLTQAGYITPETWTTWIPVSGSTAAFSIRGAISMNPAPTKQCQFISIGCNPVTAATGQNELYETVNRLFSESKFGNVDCHGFSDACQKEIRSEDDKRAQDVRRSKFSTKGTNRWPMFYLRVLFKETQYEHGPLSSRNSTESRFQLVTAGLTAVTNRWLAEHHFRAQPIKHSPKNTAPRGQEISATNRKRRKTNQSLRSSEDSRPSTTERGNSSNINSVTTDVTAMDGKPRSGGIMTSPTQKSPNVPAAREPLREATSRMSSTVCNWSKMRASSRHSTNQGDARILKLPTANPVDNRRRLQFQQRDPVSATTTGSGTCLKTCFTPRLLAKVPGPQRVIENLSGGWPENLLSRWENPVFRCSENAVHRNRESFSETTMAASYLGSLGAYQGVQRLSANGLQRARVIAQLDSKFILILMPVCATPGGTGQSNTEEQEVLAVLDQHAGDERCMIERLLSELCEQPPRTRTASEIVSNVEDHARSTQLANPITLRVDSRDKDVLQTCSSRFARWGVAYKIKSALDQSLLCENDSSFSLTIESLPHGIAERCSAEPTLLLNVLRQEAWARQEHGGRAQPHFTLLADEEEKHPWLRHVGDCPRGIVDMLISRACRSAIMFNDSLTLDECRNLCSRLAGCALPFQCAHGRPSLVPVVNLGTSDWERGGVLPAYPSWRNESFIGAYRRRMQRNRSNHESQNI